MSMSYLLIKRMVSEMKKTFYAQGWILLCIAFILFIIVTWTDVQTGNFLSKGNLLMLVILLGGGLQLFTWRNDERAKKDEMGKHIVYRSSLLSYRILVVALFALWLIDRHLYNRTNEFGNEMLFTGFCISLIILPAYQFILSKRYR